MERARARPAFHLLAALLAAGLAQSCVSRAPERPAQGSPRVVERGPFSLVVHGRVDLEDERAILDRLETEGARIREDLGLASAEACAVHLRTDPSEHLATMEKLIRGRYPGVTGYIVDRFRIELLYWEGSAGDAVHEYAHTQTLRLNPRLRRGPRWLWESLAVYEAGERVEPATLWYLSRGRFPSLAELNEDANEGGRVYEVSWLVIDFIKRGWGWGAVLDLAKTGGEIEAVLGLDRADFENRLAASVLAGLERP